MITQIAPAHLEGFGSIDGVARAKGELLDALPQRGTAVLNAQCEYFESLRTRAGQRSVLSFATDKDADVVAKGKPEEHGPVVRIDFRAGPLAGQQIAFEPRLLGQHNVVNAAAAAAAASAIGATAREIQIGLHAVAAEKGRLESILLSPEIRLLDDTYNANLTSLTAALEVLADFPGEKWAVLGDMAELGEESSAMHASAVEAVGAHGVARVFGLGQMITACLTLSRSNSCGYESLDCLVRELKVALRKRTPGPLTILIKGSRSMRMERIVETLVAGDLQCS